jgi:hypothetical protein
MGRFGFLEYKNGLQRKYKNYNLDENTCEENVKQHTKSYEVMDVPLLKYNC